MPTKKYSKSDLVLHLYDVAQDLLNSIADTSEENREHLNKRLISAKENYLGRGTWWDWLRTSFRWRGPELDDLIKSLDNELDELPRLQAFRVFIEKGGWRSTSINTAIFNNILKDMSVDFLDNDDDLKKFVIKTLKEAIINSIDAKEAAFLKMKVEALAEKKAMEKRALEVARLKMMTNINCDLSQAQAIANDENKTSIYYLPKGDIHQFYWIDANQDQFRLIHSGLKPFYGRTLTESELQAEQFDELKNVLLESVCDIKQSLNENSEKNLAEKPSSRISVDTSNKEHASQSGPIDAEAVLEKLEESQLDHLKYTLEVNHGLRTPSKSSAQVKNEHKPLPSEIKLKYSPEFFQTLENHFDTKKKKPALIEATNEKAIGPNGKEIGRIKIPDVVAEHISNIAPL